MAGGEISAKTKLMTTMKTNDDNVAMAIYGAIVLFALFGPMGFLGNPLGFPIPESLVWKSILAVINFIACGLSVPLLSMLIVFLIPLCVVVLVLLVIAAALGGA